MLTVTIIGSLSNEKDMMDAVHFAQGVLKAKVFYPENCTGAKSLLGIQKWFLNKIEESDFVIVVPKIVHDILDDSSDGIYRMGESTTYGIAYAQHIKKPILIWRKDIQHEEKITYQNSIISHDLTSSRKLLSSYQDVKGECGYIDSKSTDN